MKLKRRTEVDPLTRAGATAVAVARISLGTGIFFAPRLALKALRFGEPGGETIALARLAGGRDIALGLQALSALDDRDALREATMLGAGVDGGDAVAFAALATDPIRRGPALVNAAIAASAVAAGAFLAQRLA